jgi:hypothetical protein
MRDSNAAYSENKTELYERISKSDAEIHIFAKEVTIDHSTNTRTPGRIETRCVVITPRVVYVVHKNAQINDRTLQIAY